ncbi:hypothetical protein H1D32_23830 [Anaerobacillus sp. CMMVII]|uniref:hypothetical protein n=1 Tax=Anaerobacillus sp. CMMVII TaxID=2755588 RepID=UPI0021B8034D|nr:hypothetical protein [Anaerobacillus sp. CMMVII]MCT8140456.1 hypothetical protein [Anaerobacillus sp. CMMVII]
MKKMGAWIVVIMFLFLITVVGKDIFNEEKLKADYYELIVAVSELFKDHAQEEEYFYNRSYSNQEAIAKLLNGKVTENGFFLVVETLFEEYDDLFVYKPKYQDYISDTRDFRYPQRETSFYETVRNTLLNPAIGLIPFNELDIEREKNRITIAAQEIKVRFYGDEERLAEYHQYARFGFPPKDYISFTLSFILKMGSTY